MLSSSDSHENIKSVNAKDAMKLNVFSLIIFFMMYNFVFCPAYTIFAHYEGKHGIYYDLL